MEGTPTVLIEHGRVRRRALAKELLTEPELLTLVHRQGFSELKDVERCVIEPGGSFSIKGKQPPEEERRYTELMARLDQIGLQVQALRPANPDSRA
jgi:uncharacterized membrane protein YcaP (DUF421 family)